MLSRMSIVSLFQSHYLFLQVLLHAVEMLHSRVDILLRYVAAVSRGELPRNTALLRRINSLTGRLGLLQSADFYSRLYTQCNDVSLTVLLGRIAQSCTTLQQVSRSRSSRFYSWCV